MPADEACLIDKAPTVGCGDAGVQVQSLARNWISGYVPVNARLVNPLCRGQVASRILRNPN